jgi:hypothetical protein
MANTVEIALTQTGWTALAEGPGDVNLTAAANLCVYAISSSGAPGFKLGHSMPLNENEAVRLVTGETLFGRGPGAVYVTADVPPS